MKFCVIAILLLGVLQGSHGQEDKKLFVECMPGEWSKVVECEINRDYEGWTIKTMFERFGGEVTDIDISGTGYAIVTMIDKNAAQAVIKNLNGFPLYFSPSEDTNPPYAPQFIQITPLSQI